MAGAVCGDHVHRFRIQRFCRQLGQNVTTWITSPHNYLMQQLSQQQVLGYIVVGFTESGLAGFVTTAVVLVALVFIVKKR